MHIDELIHKLEELRSKHEDLHVYIWHQDDEWQGFSIEIFRRSVDSINPIADKWVGIRQA